MRKNYKILWLDDDFDDDSSYIEGVINNVNTHLKAKSFILDVCKIDNFNDAIKELIAPKKFDMVISDYNIGDKETGLDFLSEVRKAHKLEVFLYSNNDIEAIKEHVKNKISDPDTNLSFFTKFSFESSNNINMLKKSICGLVDLTLIRWEELNALRGLYLSETSQIETDLKQLIDNKKSCVSFISDLESNLRSNTIIGEHKRDELKEIIKKLKSNYRVNHGKIDFYTLQILFSKFNSTLYNEWEEIRALRNGFAHVKETANGITLKDNKCIQEKDIYNHRQKLIAFIDNLEVIIKHYQTFS